MMSDSETPAVLRKRCGWLFNAGLTFFVGFASVVNTLFGSATTKGTLGRTNLSLLPWVHGSFLAEAVTGLAIIVLFLALLSLFIWQTWNRLVARLFGPRKIQLGEAYTVVLWILLIAIMY